MKFKEFLKLTESGGLWAGVPIPVTGKKKPSDGWNAPNNQQAPINQKNMKKK